MEEGGRPPQVVISRGFSADMARISALMACSSNSRAIRSRPSTTTGPMAKVASARHSLALSRKYPASSIALLSSSKRCYRRAGAASGDIKGPSAGSAEMDHGVRRHRVANLLGLVEPGLETAVIELGRVLGSDPQENVAVGRRRIDREAVDQGDLLAVAAQRERAADRALAAALDAERDRGRAIRQRGQVRIAEADRDRRVPLSDDERDGDAEDRLQIHGDALATLEGRRLERVDIGHL